MFICQNFFIISVEKRLDMRRGRVARGKSQGQRDLDEIIIIGDAPTNALGAIKEFIGAMTESGRIENLAYVVLTDQLAAVAFGQGVLTADELATGEEADTPDETSITIRGKDFGSGIGTFDVKILCANGLNPIGLDHKGEWMTV